MSIGRKTLTNIAGSVIPLLVTIITVPLYLKILGDVRYGVLALVWLILSYFAFLEMGLGKATTNHIARLNDAPDSERASLFWTALAVNAGFGMVAAVIFWGIGSYLMTNVLKIPPEFRAEALAALPWIIATLPLALVSSVLNGALEGRNRFFVVNGLQIASALVFQVVPLAVAYIYGPSLSVVIPAAVLSRAFMNIPFLGACFFYVPLSTRPAFSRESVRSLMSYGGWVAISGMIGPILETMDRFLIGVILGAQAVTHYTVPYQLVTKARVLPGSLSRALFPKFSAAESQETDALAVASLHSLALAMTPLVVGGIVFLHPFMIAWVGKDLATIASPLGGIFVFGIWINSLAYIPYCLLQAKGKPDIVAKFHALELGPFLLVLWAALYFWGITGAAWAWTIRTVTDAVLLFRFSGMPKRSLWALGEPALMVSFATLGARSIVGESWPWRAALFLILVMWVGRWLAKNKVGALITAYRARQTNAAVGEEEGLGSREKKLA